MKKIILKNVIFLVTILFMSCTALNIPTGTNGYDGTGGYGNINIGSVTRGTVKGQFQVQLIECVGNASSQNVTAIMLVTNTGPNAYLYIGGSLNGSVAIDSHGMTSKPYGSAGQQYDLPSNVTVRVEIPRIEPVRPGTPMFQSLGISFGTGANNMIYFRNVPIVWSN